MPHHRLARDYEALPGTSTTMIHIAMIHNLPNISPPKPPQPEKTRKTTH